MKKDPSIFLHHILESIEIIEGFTKDINKSDFFAFYPNTRRHRQKVGDYWRSNKEFTQELSEEICGCLMA